MKPCTKKKTRFDGSIVSYMSSTSTFFPSGVSLQKEIRINDRRECESTRHWRKSFFASTTRPRDTRVLPGEQEHRYRSHAEKAVGYNFMCDVGRNVADTGRNIADIWHSIVDIRFNLSADIRQKPLYETLRIICKDNNSAIFIYEIISRIRQHIAIGIDLMLNIKDSLNRAEETIANTNVRKITHVRDLDRRFIPYWLLIIFASSSCEMIALYLRRANARNAR